MLLTGLPALLNARPLLAANQQLALVEAAIAKAQTTLFPSAAYPSGVTSAFDLKAGIFGLYARAMRDLSTGDALLGTKRKREEYAFGINSDELSRILPTGLFDPVKFELSVPRQEACLLDGLKFSKAGLELLKILEAQPEMISKYTRAGIFKQLQNMAGAPRRYLGKEYRVELTAPMGLVDFDSGGTMRGTLVDIKSEQRSFHPTPSSKIEIPSLQVVLAKRHFEPGRLFYLREAWCQKLKIPVKHKPVSEKQIKEEYIPLELDDIFLLEPIKKAGSIVEAEFSMLEK